MRDLALNRLTGDLDTGGGDLHHVNGLAAIRQRVWIRLRLFLGEWFLNNQLGVDYFGQVLVRHPNMPAIEAMLRGEILETPGVIRITRYSQSWDEPGRKLWVSFAADTDAGQIETEGLL